MTGGGGTLEGIAGEREGMGTGARDGIATGGRDGVGGGARFAMLFPCAPGRGGATGGRAGTGTLDLEGGCTAGLGGGATPGRAGGGGGFEFEFPGLAGGAGGATCGLLGGKTAGREGGAGERDGGVGALPAMHIKEYSSQ